MAINFPNNPAVNDTFTVGGTKFTFTGVKWESGAVVEISSDTTPSLGGALDAGTHNINNVGVITATTFSGNLTGNVTGTATNAQGLTGDPSIQVTNATVLGNLDVQGTTTTIDTAITEVDSLTVDGNVGIGTTIPQVPLHVFGNTRVRVGTDQVFSVTSTDGVTQLQGINEAADTFKHLDIAGSEITLSPNSSEALRIKSDGSVAIGTATGENNFLTTINGDLSLGEKSGADNTYIDQKQDGNLEIINSGRTANDGGVRINRHNNISGDTTYFRDFVVYDGKGTALLTVDGSAGTVSDSKGDLRKIPFKQESSAYTLVLADSGKAIEVQGDVTVPNNVFNSGDTITIINDSSSNKTISKGTGLQYMFNTADGTNANRTLGGRGMATIYFVNGTTCYISGSQLT